MFPSLLVLFKRRSESGDEFSTDVAGADTAVLAQLDEAYSATIDELGQLHVSPRPPGDEVDWKDLLRTGGIEIVGEFGYEFVKTTLQVAVHNKVWTNVLIRLVVREKNPTEWSIEQDDRGMYLVDPSGERVGEYVNSSWWLTDSPEHAGAIGRALID